MQAEQYLLRFEHRVKIWLQPNRARSPVVFITDRSKAVVLILVVLYVPVWPFTVALLEGI